jgi:phage-related baseplate assembly protein
MSLISYRISYELRATSYEFDSRRPVFSSQLAARSSQRISYELQATSYEFAFCRPAFNSQLAARSSRLQFAARSSQLLLLGDQS